MGEYAKAILKNPVAHPACVEWAMQMLVGRKAVTSSMTLREAIQNFREKFS